MTEGLGAQSAESADVREVLAEQDAARRRQVVPREGMLTVYDHNGVYAGCIGAHTWQRLLDGALQQAEHALQKIAETARWYADNGQRLQLEVDHALCVEVLDLAERGAET